MAWAPVDDKLHSHPKFVSLSLEAVGLWTVCLSWSADQLTDGFLPENVVRRFAGAKYKKLTTELNAVVAPFNNPLWEKADGGWRIHDYLTYNKDAATVKAERAERHEKRAEAGRRGAAARWQGDSKPDGKAMANGMANPWQTDSKPMAPSQAHPIPCHKHTKAKAAIQGGTGGETAAAGPPAEEKKGEDAAFVAMTLAAHPEWLAPLEKRVAQRTPQDPDAYRATVLRGWLEGDGTPGQSARAEHVGEREKARDKRTVRAPSEGQNPGTSTVFAAPLPPAPPLPRSATEPAEEAAEAVVIELPDESEIRRQEKARRVAAELQRLQEAPDEMGKLVEEIALGMPEEMRRPGNVLYERTVESQLRKCVSDRVENEMDAEYSARNIDEDLEDAA